MSDTGAASPFHLTREQYEQIAKTYFTSKRSYSLIPLLVGQVESLSE